MTASSAAREASTIPKPATLHTWRSLTDDGSVRWLKYSFGPGTANTLAIRLDDGSWLVVGPPSGSPTPVLDALAHDGGVSALVAPNAYHHLGQGVWRLRFPEAVSYAPEGAFARLHNKSQGVAYRPIDELAKKLPPRVSFFVADGMKTPDLMVRASSGDATLWWMGDLFSNTTVADQIWVLRLLARLAGSGVGYRRNSKPGMVYVRDKDSWLASIRAAIERHAPSIVMPAHGNPILEDTARRTQALLNDPE